MPIQDIDADHSHSNIQPYSNHRSSNYRLPSELVSIIFDTFRDKLGFIEVQCIIPLSHVCRFWRDVALCTPALWTSVDFYRYGVQCAKECFIRSRPLPLRLTVFAHHDIPSVVEALESASWLSAYTHRVRWIDIESEAEVVGSLFDKLGRVIPTLSSADSVLL